jgi:excisionase family DNA binding protein|tara:strand:- start:1006 stop:1191 length:186 start_codon:yes stop_codon:yes gene_type:complete
MNLEDRWVCIAELGKYLSLSKPTIYKCVKDGKLPKPRRVGTQKLLWYKPDIKKAMLALPDC